MEDSRCICNKCGNQFKLRDVYRTNIGCILKIPTNNIPLECSHFKPKKVEDKEQLGKLSDIKDKETLKRKGQSIKRCPICNMDMIQQVSMRYGEKYNYKCEACGHTMN